MPWIGVYMILLGLLMSGCLQTQAGSAFTDGRFSMQYPNGSIAINQGGVEIFRDEYSPGDGSVCSFVIEKKVNSSIGSLSESLKGFMKSKNANITDESEKGGMVDFRSSMFDDLTGKTYESRIRLLACDESAVYVLLASCDLDSYNKNKEVFESVVNSAQCK